jgi:Ran GTPase-activating protein (RanGAP) involved in mRNA processing and transport
MSLLAQSAGAAKALLSELMSTSRTGRAIFLGAAVDDDFAAALAKALSTACHALTALHLQRVSISQLGTRHLATGLVLHGRLRTLDLSDTPCGDAGCAHLAALLPACTSLRTLSLRGDRIGPAGATALALALAPVTPLVDSAARRPSLPARLLPLPARQSQLESLDLCRNAIGDAGARALAKALARGATLRELDLSANWVTARGAVALAAALRGNRRLAGLTVRAMATGMDGQQKTLAALRREEERGPPVSM